MTHMEFIGGPEDGRQMHLFGQPLNYTVPVAYKGKIRYHIYERTDTVINGVVHYKWKGYS
jgi:hypothetical protein